MSADGHQLTQFTDTERPYLAGAFGMYSEDAQAQFDHIRIAQLPPDHRPSSDAAGTAAPGTPSPERQRFRWRLQSRIIQHVYPLAFPRAGSW